MKLEWCFEDWWDKKKISRNQIERVILKRWDLDDIRGIVSVFWLEDWD